MSLICNVRIYRYLDRCGGTLDVGLHISKAFDRVLHEGLLLRCVLLWGYGQQKILRKFPDRPSFKLFHSELTKESKEFNQDCKSSLLALEHNPICLLMGLKRSL